MKKIFICFYLILCCANLFAQDLEFLINNHKVNAEERQNGQGAHLHLQMYLSKDDMDEFMIKSTFDKHSNDNTSIDIKEKGIVNPFNYEDKYDNRS